MHTLLMHLCGPMQSWGSDSQFTLRTTHYDPTKSGVIGLCCAALGWKRSKDIRPLTQLHMGTRIINPGIVMNDYQTAENVILAKGSGKKTVVSNRNYISDAEFIVGLEGSDIRFLTQLSNSLHHPKFQLYLGRKSYVPSMPVFILDGLKRNVELVRALIDYKTEDSPQSEMIELIVEVPLNKADEIRYDQPSTDSFITRKFLKRGIQRKIIKGG